MANDVKERLKAALAALDSAQAAMMSLGTLRKLSDAPMDVDIGDIADDLVEEGVLKRSWLYYDGDEEHLVSDDEMAEAMEEGSLIHPETGEEVENFMELTDPVYAKA